MLAAYVFHWWLAVGLTLLSVLAIAGLGVGYLKKVVAPQYPGRRHRCDED